MEWIIGLLLFLVLLSLNRIGKQVETFLKKSDKVDNPKVDNHKNYKVPSFRNPAGSEDIFEEKREELVKLYAAFLKGWVPSKEEALIKARFEVYNFDNEEIKRKINHGTWGNYVDKADKAFYKTSMFEHDVKQQAEYLEPFDLLLPLYEVLTREQAWFDSMNKQKRKSYIKQFYQWEENTYRDFIKHNAIVYKLAKLGILENAREKMSPHLYQHGTLVNTNISEIKKIIYDGSGETSPEDSILDETVKGSTRADWEKDCKLFQIDALGWD